MFFESFLFLVNAFIDISEFTLARRCLFIAPTPPGPLRILKQNFLLKRRLKFKYYYLVKYLVKEAVSSPFSAEIRISVIAHNAYGADNTCAVTLNKSRWRTLEQFLAWRNSRYFDLSACLNCVLVTANECNSCYSVNLFSNVNLDDSRQCVACVFATPCLPNSRVALITLSSDHVNILALY